jgi:rhamnosyltransferase
MMKRQVDNVVVVDNSIDNTWRNDEGGYEYVALGENKGIAYAHNVGIDHAIRNGATHILFMDHDRVPEKNMTQYLAAEGKELEMKNIRVGAVGARYVGAHMGNESYFVRFGWIKFQKAFCADATKKYVPADFLISSGTLIPVKAIEDVGKMEEGLFIDHIDTEWFLRGREKGYQFYGVCEAVMRHGLGEDTYKIWLGRWRYLPKHKPFRYYYIFRNSILLYKRPYATFRWIINDITRLGFMLIFYGIGTKPRIEKLSMMLKGINDGLRGLTGSSVKPSGA